MYSWRTGHWSLVSGFRTAFIKLRQLKPPASNASTKAYQSSEVNIEENSSSVQCLLFYKYSWTLDLHSAMVHIQYHVVFWKSTLSGSRSTVSFSKLNVCQSAGHLKGYTPIFWKCVDWDFSISLASEPWCMCVFVLVCLFATSPLRLYQVEFGPLGTQIVPR